MHRLTGCMGGLDAEVVAEMSLFFSYVVISPLSKPLSRQYRISIVKQRYLLDHILLSRFTGNCPKNWLVSCSTGPELGAK